MGGVFKRFFALFIAAFVSMGLSIAEVIPAVVGVTGFVVLVLAAVADMVWSIRRIRRGWPELMELPEAIRGTGEILEAYETNLYAYMGEPEGYAPKTYALDLRVSLPGRPGYEIRHYTTAHRWATSHMAKGNRVPVFVHPTKPKRMHVDFGEVPGGPAGSEGAGRVNVNVVGGESMLTPEMIDAIEKATGMGPGSVAADTPEGSQAVRAATGLDLGALIEKAMTEGTRGPGGQISVADVPGVTLELPDQVTVTNTRLDLAASGVMSTATVRGVKSLGVTSAVGPIIELDLEVQVPGGGINRVSQRIEMPQNSIPTVGHNVEVKVDPGNPGRILVKGESGTSW